MGFTCRMAVTEEAMNAIISTTKAVMKKRPMKPCHMESREAMVDTATTSPTFSRVAGFTAATPTENRFRGYIPPKSSRQEALPRSITRAVCSAGMVTVFPSRALSVERRTWPSGSQIMKCTSETMAAKLARRWKSRSS